MVLICNTCLTANAYTIIRKTREVDNDGLITLNDLMEKAKSSLH